MGQGGRATKPRGTASLVSRFPGFFLPPVLGFPPGLLRPWFIFYRADLELYFWERGPL